MLRAAALAVAACTLFAACDSGRTEQQRSAAASASQAAECAEAVGSLLRVTQRYLDGVGGTTTGGAGPTASSSASATVGPTAPSSPRDPAAEQEQFTRALQDIRGYAADRGCAPGKFQTDLQAGLRRLTAGGPVARAVLLQLQADAAGSPPRTGPLVPGDDIAAAVAAAPSGATVELSAGTFVLADTVALLRGVTLRGAGRDRTRLHAAAAGGALLVLTGEPVTIAHITVSRTGTAPGPVLSAAPVATLSLSGARVSGARADREGVGGVGILMSAGGGQTGRTRRTSLRITDTEVRDNAVAGVLVAGDHRAEIVRTVVARSGQCGVCFLGTSDGIVRASRLSDNDAGVVTGGDARPKIEGTTVTGGQVGIQAIERSAPEIIRTTVTKAARAAMIWTGTATGRLEANRCVDVKFGIVVGPNAVPFLGTNECQVARGQQ